MQTNFPTGTHTYTLQGQIGAQTGINGYTVQANTNPSSDWTGVTGNTTGNSITPSVTNFTMSTMTVKTARSRLLTAVRQPANR